MKRGRPPSRETFWFWIAMHNCALAMFGTWNMHGMKDPDMMLLKDAEAIAQEAYDRGSPGGYLW